MLNSISTEIMHTRKFFAPVLLQTDPVGRVTAISFSNMMSLLKLRQKEVTKVTKLSKDVFRCILEYDISKELCCRYSELYVSINKKQDRHFPSIEKLSYDNYLVAVNELPNSF